MTTATRDLTIRPTDTAPDPRLAFHLWHDGAVLDYGFQLVRVDEGYAHVVLLIGHRGWVNGCLDLGPGAFHFLVGTRPEDAVREGFARIRLRCHLGHRLQRVPGSRVETCPVDGSWVERGPHGGIAFSCMVPPPTGAPVPMLRYG